VLFGRTSIAIGLGHGASYSDAMACYAWFVVGISRWQLAAFALQLAHPPGHQLGFADGAVLSAGDLGIERGPHGGSQSGGSWTPCRDEDGEAPQLTAFSDTLWAVGPGAGHRFSICTSGDRQW
jgi:hypothetical protein